MTWCCVIFEVSKCRFSYTIVIFTIQQLNQYKNEGKLALKHMWFVVAVSHQKADVFTVNFHRQTCFCFPNIIDVIAPSDNKIVQMSVTVLWPHTVHRLDCCSCQAKFDRRIPQCHICRHLVDVFMHSLHHTWSSDSIRRHLFRTRSWFHDWCCGHDDTAVFCSHVCFFCSVNRGKDSWIR